MRRMTPLPHNRRDETVGVPRTELGIHAVRTETTMAVRPKRAPWGQPRPFTLESGAASSQFDRAGSASSDQKHKETSTHHGVPPTSWSTDSRSPSGGLF